MIQYAQQIAENSAASIGPHYDPLTVIVLEHNGSNHAFQLNKPYIIVNGKNFRLLHDSGKTDDTRYSAVDKPRLATDEEIEKCLEDLNAAQLRKIMTHELFAPIVHKMYEAETELVVEEEKKIFNAVGWENKVICRTKDEYEDFLTFVEDNEIRINKVITRNSNHNGLYFSDNQIEANSQKIIEMDTQEYWYVIKEQFTHIRLGIEYKL